MPKLPNIAFVHGSGQSNVSFNYFDIFLPEHNALALEYQTQEDPSIIIERFNRVTKQSLGDEPFYVIAHSYGCLLSALLAIKNSKVEKLVALSSPWSGSYTAKWLNMVFRQSKLFMNVKPNSYFIQDIQQSKLSIPILNVVTTGSKGSGNDLAGLGSEHNDGLLTVATQKSLPPGFTNCNSIEVPLSHNEVLLSYDTINIIKTHLFGR